MKQRCPTCGRRKTRSNQANARYWLLLHKISSMMKPAAKVYSADNWHEYFKSRYIGCNDVDLPNGQTLVMPRSSADLDTSEFSDYATKVEVWANEHDVYLDELTT